MFVCCTVNKCCLGHNDNDVFTLAAKGIDVAASLCS